MEHYTSYKDLSGMWKMENTREINVPKMKLMRIVKTESIQPPQDLHRWKSDGEIQVFEYHCYRRLLERGEK